MKAAVAILLSFVLVFTACHGPVKVARLDAAQVHHPEREQVVGVTTRTAQDVVFDPRSGYIKDGIIHAQVQSAAWQLPVDQAQTLWIERRELRKAATIGLTAGLVVAGFVVMIGIIAAVKGSCPFVYSWDGTEYVFDAEPYGGAITRGLERDDYAELHHLKAVDGEYRLLLTNEVDETQYTNLTELWVVDHLPGTAVAADEFGKLYTLDDLRPPVAARDAQGRDLLPWLEKNDRLIWEPAAESDAGGDGLRQDITLTFPKPAGAGRAKLVVNAATGLWGSYLIRQILELRGRDVDNRYKALDHDQSARDRLRAWNLREELFMLKVWVEEPGGWVERGIIPGGGPALAPTRVVPLDVSAVRGSELRIRIHPPRGSWALNSVAVDYGEEKPLTVTKASLSAAHDDRGRSVHSQMLESDGSYYEMPAIGDRAYLTFPTPPPTPGMARSVFLHSRGYYRLHLESRGRPAVAELKRIEGEPGYTATFSAERYARWKVKGVAGAE